MTDADTKNCKLRFAIRVTGADGTPSKRITWCCRERYGFMLKHWKCVGLGHELCPLTNGTLSFRAGEAPPARDAQDRT